MKIIKLFISLLLVLTIFGCSNKPNVPVTGSLLAEVLEEKVDEKTSDKELSNQEVIQKLLLWSGMDEKQLGDFPDDYNSFAESLGLIEKLDNKDLSVTCMSYDLYEMKEIVDQLKEAVNRDVKKPLFINGMAQPIFPYTTGAVEEGYSNETSNIIRFSVFVETDYDTDDDGKLDLVKAVVQLPKAAMEGDYKAATIYEARPYISGCTPYYGLDGIEGEKYDMAKLYNKPEARTPVKEETTKEVAAKAKSSEWYYFSPYEDIYDYEDLDWYDYYLVRGYAVVESAGLGTRGSEGFETCGSDVEVLAFKNIIEWLTGDRIAYTDKTSNIEIKADWSNGNVAMTGRSYSGTTPFAVAQTGVKGLKTIVPVAGIASWYDYMNSQGTALYPFPQNYLNSLAVYCAGRYLDPEDWESIKTKYGNYLHQLHNDQKSGGSDYSGVWANRDYTIDSSKLNCSALIVHGANDYNVRTKHAEMMFNTFKKQNQTVKLMFHQGAHITPVYQAGGYAVKVNGENYDDILNKWFSHYLYDLNNGAENMPEVLAQSNLNANVWNSYNNWENGGQNQITISNKDKTVNISTDYNSANITAENRVEETLKGSSLANATYIVDVDEDFTIKGSIPVKFNAALKDGEGKDDLPITVMLVDFSDEEFATYALGSGEYYVNKETVKEKGVWLGGGVTKLDLKEFKPTMNKYKVIATGWVDLCNPESEYDSASSQNSITPKKGEFNEYTVYLHPNIYTVQKGHKLALIFTTYDHNTVSYDKNYSFDLKSESINVSIPKFETNQKDMIGEYKE